MGAVFVFAMGMLFGFLLGIFIMSLLAINGWYDDEDNEHHHL